MTCTARPLCLHALVVVLATLGCSLSTVAPASAQTAPPVQTTPERPWSLSLVVGHALGGPAEEIETAMRAAGFDATTDRFGHVSAYPYSYGANSAGLDLTYRRSRKVALSLLLSSGDAGITAGVLRGTFERLDVKSRATILAPLVSARLGPHLRVGAGPLLARTSVGHIDRRYPVDGLMAQSRASKLGAVVAATAECSLEGLLLSVTASYRWIPAVTGGPFTASDGVSNLAGTLPAFRANLSHTRLSAGLGWRF